MLLSFLGYALKKVRMMSMHMIMSIQNKNYGSSSFTVFIRKPSSNETKIKVTRLQVRAKIFQIRIKYLSGMITYLSSHLNDQNVYYSSPSSSGRFFKLSTSLLLSPLTIAIKVNICRQWRLAMIRFSIVSFR